MEINVRIAKDREGAFVSEMNSRAVAPWSVSKVDTHDREPELGHYYFHRDQSDDQAPCMVSLYVRAEGHLVSGLIVPDIGFNLEQRHGETILREFDEKIVGPAAQAVDGISSIDSQTNRLEDYFSRDAIRVLQSYCNSAENEFTWWAFLIQAHKDKSRVHCDIFRRCLKASGLKPVVPVDTLVSQYDFGLNLLAQFEKEN